MRALPLPAGACRCVGTARGQPLNLRVLTACCSCPLVCACKQIPAGWWVSTVALHHGAASFGAKMIGQGDRNEIASAVRTACAAGTLEPPLATLPQGGGPALETGGVVRPLQHLAAAGEAAERGRGTSSWWARPTLVSSLLCPAVESCLHEWEAGHPLHAGSDAGRDAGRDGNSDGGRAHELRAEAKESTVTRTVRGSGVSSSEKIVLNMDDKTHYFDMKNKDGYIAID
mmetsp:Transcript_16675/g.42848  ORF Transcript_16675/g.42848 Transcript_16675/m.42848 type:complete len:229 (+) Transcript_16675:969-1655(+)